VNSILIYALPLKSVAFLMLIAFALWTAISVSIRIISRKERKILRLLWRALNAILSAISLAVILRYTVVQRAGGDVYTMPFIRSMEQIQAQPELIREMVMNALLFFPLGLTLPYAINTDYLTNTNRTELITIAAAFILSGAIELIQYVGSMGNAELSDIVMNTLGTCIGALSHSVSHRIIAHGRSSHF